MIDGLRLFELGDDRDVTAVRGDDLLGFADIGSRADKGLGDGVDAMTKAEFEISLVFVRERRNRQRNTGQVDALVLAKHASVDHITENVLAANRADTEFDQAVAEKNARACGEF